jgi:hypothetical protein
MREGEQEGEKRENQAGIPWYLQGEKGKERTKRERV